MSPRLPLTSLSLLLAACHAGFQPLRDAAADAPGGDRPPAVERLPGERPPDAAASGWTLVYEDPAAEATESLNALFVAGAGRVVAVGDNRQIVSLEGGAWQALNKTKGAHLYGVWGRSADDVTAVGLYAWNGAPAIFRYDGKLWTPEGPLPAQLVALSEVWGEGTQRYFVGKAGHIFQDDPVGHPTDRYHLAAVTGGCPLRTDPAPTLWSIDGSGLGNILVAGDGGLMAHFDGKGWLRLCHPDGSVAYRSVFRIPGSEEHMVGGNYLGLHRFIDRAQMIVLHEDRSLKDADKTFLWSVWGTSSASLIAVGDGGTILYYNGGASGPRRLPSPTTEALFAVAGASESEVYLCGQRNRIWRGKLPSD